MHEPLEIHEIATLFPVMSEVDADHLRASLMQEGQLQEILVFEGKILDGRHRYQTCLELGIEPRIREFEGSYEEAFSHSVALNLGRRHLTTVQRAAAGAGIKAFQSKLLAGDDDLAPAPSQEASAPAAPAAEPQPPAEQADPSEPSRQDSPSEEASEVSSESAAAPEPAPAPKKKRKKPSPRTINKKAREIASRQVGVSPRAIDVAEKIKETAPDVFERMLQGTAGSIPDAKRVTALPAEERNRIHALVDEGVKLKEAMRQVSPPPAPAEGPVFLGKVLLEPEQARAFAEILERRELKRADAAKEAILDWITKHGGEGADAEQPATQPELVNA
ncbi:MAG TPA: hypothetical protein DEA08_01530 [Planctomycetes bacterium]|nr:hypothetical protein [Planctomycetota bacterium]